MNPETFKFIQEKRKSTMDMNHSVISAVRKDSQQRVTELINALGLFHVKEWSGYDLLLVAVERNHREVARLLLLNGCKCNGNKEFSATPLHHAAASGDIEIVKMLLDRDAKIDAKNVCGRTPLHLAVEKNQIKIIKLLLNVRACINTSDRDGVTPLHLACKENNREIMETLLNADACINPTINFTCKRKICEGYTPLHYAVEIGSQEITTLLVKENADVNIEAICGTPLHIASAEGHHQIALYLLNHGAVVNSRCPSTGDTPLHVACASGSTEIIKSLLIWNADINAIGAGKLTPLLLAMKKKDGATAKLLLENGADVDAQDEYGMTVLCRAVDLGLSDIVKLLLKFSPDLSNESNRSSLKLAIYAAHDKKYKEILQNLLNYGFKFNSEDIDDLLLLHHAICYGYWNIVKDLLAYGTDVNMPFGGKKHTPLHTAVIYQQREAAELLITYGADVNIKDVSQKTPIFYTIQNCDRATTKLLLSNKVVNIRDDPEILIAAAMKRSIITVEILLKYDPDIVNGRDKYGRTALHCIALGHADNVGVNIAKLLLKKGARVDLPHVNGTTILQAAVEKNYTKLVEILLQYNADVNSAVQGAPTPLHMCVQRKNKTIAQMLLSAGAAVNAERSDGKTPLCIAIEMGQEAVVKMLLEYGADSNLRAHGDLTPLHLATLRGHAKIIQSLVEFGADVNSLDAYGRSALHMACRGIHRNTIIALLQNGSDINVRSNESITANDLPCIGSLLRQPLTGTCNCDSENSKIIVRHIAILKAKGLFVDERYLQAIGTNLILNRYYSSYEKEMGKMKNKKIDNTNLSYYDVLTKGVHQLSLYARNKSLVRVLESREYIEMFPIYADTLENQFKKAQERQYLAKSGTESFHLLCGHELPHHLVDEIFSYLSNVDLWNLIDSSL